jgi:hypothetical protein
MTTAEMRDAIEVFGYHFLKDKDGWACYDADTRQEVPNTRSPRYGDTVHLAADHLGMDWNPERMA